MKKWYTWDTYISLNSAQCEQQHNAGQRDKTANLQERVSDNVLPSQVYHSYEGYGAMAEW